MPLIAHALLEALLNDFCQEMAIPEARFREMLLKKRVCPRLLGEVLYRDWGVEYTSENWLVEEPARSVLRSRHMETPDQATRPSKPLNVSRAMRTKNAAHPFVLWLDSQGLTVGQWAESHGFKRAKVQSWMSKGKGRRRCPDAVRDRIEAESRGAVPASAWGE